MKGSRIFIVCITLFLLVMFLIQLQMPKQFSWTPTFAHDDRNPFGCYVVDSMLSHAMPNGYTVQNKTLYQLSKEDKKQGVLIVSNSLNLSKLDIKSMENIVKRGGKVMIVGRAANYDCTEMDSLLSSKFGMRFSNGYQYFDLSALRRNIEKQTEGLIDTISWMGLREMYPRKKYTTYSMLMNSQIVINKTKQVHKLAFYKEYAEVIINSISNSSDSTTRNERRFVRCTIAAKCAKGKGELIMVGAPLLFTNYGMLTGNLSGYIFRLMSQMEDLPVVRTQVYMEMPNTDVAVRNQESPFRYFLEQPPLRWALYLTVLTILIFMLFTARRRQRVIPVVEKPKNKSLEFVQLIGTLYYHRHDNTDLVRKKIIYFAEELRRRWMIDVMDTADNDRIFSVISQKTGMAYENVAGIIKGLRLVYYLEINIPSEDMRRYIDQMNEILKN
jgi:hypothetical protein